MNMDANKARNLTLSNSEEFSKLQVVKNKCRSDLGSVDYKNLKIQLPD